MKKLLLIGLFAASIFFVGCGKTPVTTNVDAFAKCLTTAGAKMYGTATCPHCLKQKELFGESFQYVTYVDCLATPAACGGIDRVPTWEFADGSQIQGEQEFATLADKTNCVIK